MMEALDREIVRGVAERLAWCTEALRALVAGEPIQPRTLTLRLPLTPPALLFPNNRLRHGKRTLHEARKLAAQMRKDVATVAASQAGHPEAPLFCGPTRCRVTVHWERVRSPRYPNGRYRARPDGDNLAASLKPVWDGLQDAKIISDDKHLIPEPPGQANDPDGAGFVVVELWEA